MKTIIELEKDIKKYTSFVEASITLEQTKAICKIIESRLRIANISYEHTKEDKWIHIAIVLEGLLKEIRGEK